jgi:hypothetical protein
MPRLYCLSIGTTLKACMGRDMLLYYYSLIAKYTLCGDCVKLVVPVLMKKKKMNKKKENGAWNSG